MRVSSTPLAALILSLPALCACFLLPPPDLRPTDAQLAALSTIPSTAVAPVSTAITVGCTGCAWHKDVFDQEGVPYQAGLESELVFDITILENRHTLKINNVNILPFGPEIALTALQIPATVASTDIFFVDHAFRPLKLGYDLLVTGSLVPDTSTKEIAIHLRVTSVEGIRNDEIEEIEVVVHEDTTNGNLELISMTKKPLEGAEYVWIDFPLPSPPAVENDDDQVGCQGIGCVLAKLRHKMDKLRGNHVAAPGKKGCPGKGHKEHDPPSYGGDHHHGGPDHGWPHHGGPHSGPHRGGPHRHGRPHHHNHHHGHFFTALIGRVLVPIFIGIMAGVGVSLFGLVIGQGLIKLYQAAMKRRNGVNGQNEEDAGTDEEKGLLKGMEVQEDEETTEGPPAYVEEGIEPVEKE